MLWSRLERRWEGHDAGAKREGFTGSGAPCNDGSSWGIAERPDDVTAAIVWQAED